MNMYQLPGTLKIDLNYPDFSYVCQFLLNQPVNTIIIWPMVI